MCLAALPSWLLGQNQERLRETPALSTVDQKYIRRAPPYDGWISSKSFFKTPRSVLKKSPFFKPIWGRFEDIFKNSGLQKNVNRGTEPDFEDIFKKSCLQKNVNRGLTEEDAAKDPELLRLTNLKIERRRSLFDADVTVLCKLVEAIFGPKGCSPNLHDLYCVVGWLLRRKGHPKFELGIQRLV